MSYESNIDLPAIGNIHRHTKQYQRQKARALAVIARALKDQPKFYLGLSGGKDSVALLAMLMQAGAHGDLWAHVSDASFPGTVETCRRCEELSGWPLTLDESPVSAFDVIGKQSTQKFGKKGYFFDAIKRFVEEGKYQLCFTGVRAAESTRRTRGFRAQGHIFKTSTPSPITRCDAIAHFRIEDVAAAIVESGLPFHPIYSKTPVSDRSIRLGYATNLDLVERETVIFLKRNYPQLFIKFCNAWPQARRYV